MLLVTSGEFHLVFQDRTDILNEGDWCEVPTGTVHYEKSGVDGAAVLAGKK